MHQTAALSLRARSAAVLALSLLGLSLASPSVEAVPVSGATNYFFESWPLADGSDLNSVTAIVQSQDGYLWLGTYNGLVRFDGVRFTTFLSSNTRGLQNNRITSFFEDDKGVLWIGHETGDLTRYSAGQFQPVRLVFNWVGGPIE